MRHFGNCVEHNEQQRQKRKLPPPNSYDQWQVWESKRRRVSSSTKLDDESEVNWRHERHMILKKTTTAYEEELWQKWCAQKSKSQSNLMDDGAVDVRLLRHMQILSV